MSLVRSILDRKGSLVWSLIWPWGVSSQFLILLGCSAMWQILISRSLVIPHVLILIPTSSSAQMLSFRLLTFAKSQPQFFYYHILHVCRVL